MRERERRCGGNERAREGGRWLWREWGNRGRDRGLLREGRGWRLGTSPTCGSHLSGGREGVWGNGSGKDQVGRGLESVLGRTGFLGPISFSLFFFFFLLFFSVFLFLL
jgi:hypothetical protein